MVNQEDWLFGIRPMLELFNQKDLLLLMNRMKFFLTKKHLQFLIKNLEDPSLLIKLREFFEQSPKSMDFSENEVNRILDRLSDLLVQMDLDDEYVPNKNGLLIEEIIDVFSQKYQ